MADEPSSPLAAPVDTSGDLTLVVLVEPSPAGELTPVYCFFRFRNLESRPFILSTFICSLSLANVLCAKAAAIPSNEGTPAVVVVGGCVVVVGGIGVVDVVVGVVVGVVVVVVVVVVAVVVVVVGGFFVVLGIKARCNFCCC